MMTTGEDGNRQKDSPDGNRRTKQDVMEELENGEDARL